MTHVPPEVMLEVQNALYTFQDHKGAQIHFDETGKWAPERCDTTPELATLALDASTSGHVAGFRPPRSYFEIRTMHEAKGILQLNDEGEWHCTRSEILYESIHCPDGHFKLPIDEYKTSCTNQGLVCQERHDCFCKPCVKAHDVEVFEWTEEMQLTEGANSTEKHVGCDKMSLCGSVEQTKTVTFRVFDNMKRHGAELQVKMHMAKTTTNLPVKRIHDYIYEFSWSVEIVGVGVMEIFINGEQIPESPVRVQVNPRSCAVEFPGEHRSPTATGDCDCNGSTMEIRGKCIETTIIATVISLVCIIILSILVCWYLRYRAEKNDQVWHVSIDELHLDDPVEVIGQGSFGVVLLAEYRGTKVALKRAIKTKKKNGSKSGTRSRTRDTRGNSSDPRNNSIGLDSVGLESVDLSADSSADSPETNDPELGNQSQEIGHSTTGGHSRALSGGMAFLGSGYRGAGKFGWLFGKRDYHTQFKESILGSSGGMSKSTNSLHAMLCPWFDDNVKREKAFVQEMRVLSALRHPSITTVMGAVISRSCDPMIVMEVCELVNGSSVVLQCYDISRRFSLFPCPFCAVHGIWM